MTITITIPLPPKECSPNARCHYHAKARAVRDYRTRAKLETLSELDGEKPRFAKAQTEISWYTKTNTRPDADNALASLKAALDGVADAGFLSSDRGLSHAPIWFGVDKAKPRVLLTIRSEA